MTKETSHSTELSTYRADGPSLTVALAQGVEANRLRLDAAEQRGRDMTAAVTALASHLHFPLTLFGWTFSKYDSRGEQGPIWPDTVYKFFIDGRRVGIFFFDSSRGHWLVNGQGGYGDCGAVVSSLAAQADTAVAVESIIDGTRKGLAYHRSKRAWSRRWTRRFAVVTVATLPLLLVGWGVLVLTILLGLVTMLMWHEEYEHGEFEAQRVWVEKTKL